MMKYITPMQLKDMAFKCNSDITKVGGNDLLTLMAIISFINASKIETDGYYSWPGIDQIRMRTGISESSIKRSRKSLTEAGWISVKSGKGEGDSNKYTVNAQKILDAYLESGYKMLDRKLANPGKPADSNPVKAQRMVVEDDYLDEPY